MLTTQGVFCHAQTQRLQSRIDLQVRPRDRTVCVGQRRVGGVRTGLRWRVKLERQNTGWAGVGERLGETREKEGGETETAHETETHYNGRYDWAEMKHKDRPGCITKQAEMARARAEAWPTQRKPPADRGSDVKLRELAGGHRGCDYFGHTLHVVLGTV